MPDTFTDGFDSLLALLRPHGASGECRFPHDVKMAAVKMGEAEPPISWFRRCVDGPLGGDVQRASVEPNLAVFATIRWGLGRSLEYANIQVFKTQTALEDYYTDEGEAFILRLDWDYGTLGPIFTHALPHMHYTSFDAAPRFGLDGQWSDNIFIDFFEFVYRHLFHHQWTDWAHRIWRRDRGALLGEADPFETIVDAFRESKIGVLRERAHDVQTLKDCLRREKESWFPLRVSRADLQLLSYPT
jgi:hypothetical protein